MSDIVLLVKGKSLSGWQEVQVQKSIDSIAGSFSMAISDKYSGKMSNWDFRMGDACEIKVDNKQVIKGFIEDIDIDYDSETHSIMIGGRSILCDIVDCSFYDDATTWKNTPLQTIIKQLISRYNIDVVIDPIVGSDAYEVVSKFTANPSDDNLELITKLCMHKAILPCAYGDGYLTLTRAGGNGVCTDNISLGYNVLSGSISMSDKDRFSHYRVMGQGSSSEKKLIKVHTEPNGTATDEVVSRNRYLVSISDGDVDTGECIKNAFWEARIRAGKSRQYRYEVQGWRQSDKKGGELWPINAKVKVRDEFLDIKDTLLISDLVFNFNLDSGTTTSLGLVHPDAYDLIEQPITQIKSKFDELLGR
jgi:prophage tail gpP-like protein